MVVSGAIARHGPTDVRFGSKADICSALAHVRYYPESGHMHCFPLIDYGQNGSLSPSFISPSEHVIHDAVPRIVDANEKQHQGCGSCAK